MPFPMKIQPIDAMDILRSERAKPVAKSRLKRLFERQFQFPAVRRISSAEKLAAAAVDSEPSSLCLDKMVQSFMEDNNSEKPSRCGRHRCNCFHGNCDDSPDVDTDFPAVTGDAPPIIPTTSDAAEFVKGLVLCTSVAERNLLADASRIVENTKIGGKWTEDSRRAVADGLRALGYDAAVCKSRWEKSTSFPAGEYVYVDVIVTRERLLVDVDFRSEFEIARSTKSYRAVLQSLPCIFVGKEDRLQQIVAVVCEAARQSLKKKGLHFPPWRKPEYMRAKWLSSYERTAPIISSETREQRSNGEGEVQARGESEYGKENDNSGGRGAGAAHSIVAKEVVATAEAAAEEVTVAGLPWQPPAVKPKAAHSGAKVVTGLASVLKEKP
ncbi:uncharacterized protein LOC120109530 [Phoenix dactylifera]|uniref:Uncharacterized protein LOC103695730 n=1 Tax=Phoenix dactylifera TaxID=42345 RepID=A0A8B7BF61_PHODC|nr:uncharacterized protein LOC103695730 [Phoenix dactylifera]XP_038979192.1 uncharacterized protein LOC120109530 [Phoenix dactylifera]